MLNLGYLFLFRACLFLVVLGVVCVLFSAHFPFPFVLYQFVFRGIFDSIKGGRGGFASVSFSLLLVLSVFLP